MIRLFPGIGALFLVAGCASAAPDQLPTTDACLIGSGRQIPVSLELARTPDQRSRGLMERASLAEHSGMLFIYNNPRGADHGFWMFNTQIPLDIAYLDERGVIGSIVQMSPCLSERGSECPSYPAGVSFSLALEVNQGFFAANGVNIGDRLEMDTAQCQGSD